MKKILIITILSVFCVLLCEAQIKKDLEKQQKSQQTEAKSQQQAGLQDKQQQQQAEVPAKIAVKEVSAKVAVIVPPADSSKYAYISGTNVSLRASYSTTSDRIATLTKNEKVQISDSYYPENENEAICKTAISLYASGGNRTYLQKGTAVKIISSDGNTYKVSFTHPQYGKMTANIPSNDLESISGDKWYKIRRNSGETGWVFSKFVTPINE